MNQAVRESTSICAEAAPATRTVFCVQTYVKREGALLPDECRNYTSATEAEEVGQLLSQQVAGVLVYATGADWNDDPILARHGDAPSGPWGATVMADGEARWREIEEFASYGREDIAQQVSAAVQRARLAGFDPDDFSAVHVAGRGYEEKKVHLQFGDWRTPGDEFASVTSDKVFRYIRD